MYSGPTNKMLKTDVHFSIKLLILYVHSLSCFCLIDNLPFGQFEIFRFFFLFLSDNQKKTYLKILLVSMKYGF